MNISGLCYICLLSFIVMFAVYGDASVDQTMTPDAKGCEVAKASIDKVIYSRIFKKQDNFIFARISLTSDFGAATKPIVNGGIGIWQITDTNLQKAKQIMQQKQLTKSIAEILCIDFEKATSKELAIPLYNVVAAFLLAEGHNGDIPIRAKYKEQAQFWIAAAEITDQTSFSQKFENAANILDDNKGAQGTACFICEQAFVSFSFPLCKL
ncbi:uncharacterized protein LOC142349659 [Convolutriloba macropyga]|uniref:uncharacterized protein LOC142349659 n=1 Tax=Convolutriloba macropyga TaxID=536237 RepID=UPI003F51AD72